MTNPESVTLENEKSLQTLVRAIRLSQGEFSLILVRCNYDTLRAQIVQRLHQLSSIKICEISLPSSIKTLYTNIVAEIGDKQPNALMVFGIESVKDLDPVLVSANQVREEFRKNFSFPILLWVNDQVLQKLIRLATDFENWATAIEFKSTPNELVDFLQQKTDEIFAGDRTPNSDICWQLKTALQDLQTWEQVLDPEIQASLDFVIGLHNYLHNQIELALSHYQQSLVFWQQPGEEEVADSDRISDLPLCMSVSSETTSSHLGSITDRTIMTSMKVSPTKQSFINVGAPLMFRASYGEVPTFVHNTVEKSHYLERRGMILLHIALAYYRKAEQNRLDNHSDWEEARCYFQQSLDIFEQAKRQDLVAQNITKLGEVLRHLEAWDALRSLAEKSLKLHQKHGSQLQLAQDYGFFALLALEQSQWSEAQQVALKALKILANVPNSNSHYFGLFRFILARSQQSLGQTQDAINSLEKARNESIPQYDLHIYIRILENLRFLYFENGRYPEAFGIKQEQISIEYQYGLRAFMGAGYLHPQRHNIISNARIQAERSSIVAQEIEASGRQQDVNRLIKRMSRNDHKLTVIHGQSGVGKSSILTSGLIPALQQQPIGERDAIPIFLRFYTDWVRVLGRCLTEAIKSIESLNVTSPPDTIEAILKQLQANANKNLLTVLIFDQFEEFFFTYPDRGERRLFYDFLSQCLNTPYLKVVLSLREDYLHYLLECERLTNLDAINKNILDKSIRYYLGNFSLKDARAVIQRLTEKTHFYLEPELIDELVQDLASDFGEVRPVELQIVGAQLQTDKITTLEQYHQLGTKEKLVERFLEAAIKDCGAPNERAARLVLYLLTEENGTRPLKTRSELVADLEALDLASEVDKLENLLKILVGTGLVLLVREAPADRYQLIHDYLVSFIRQQQAPALLEELAAAKEQHKQTEEQLRQTLRQLEQALCKEKEERKRAENAEIEVLVSLSHALFLSHDQLGALTAAVKALQQLKDAELAPHIQEKTINKILQAVNEVQEHNRLDGHSNWVTSVNFSLDRERLVSASADDTIKIWSVEGDLLHSIQGHRGIVWDAVFSPDGKFIASASADTTVKIWTRDGKLLKTLPGHSDQVFSVAFSPDSNTIVSGGDRSIKLWSRDGRLLKTFSGHREAILSVSFSPDGDIIASASTDKTVRLWTKDGIPKTLQGHSFGVNSVTFSSDGKTIASASTDNTIKLWSKNGTLLKTLQGHTSSVNCVRFSPDSKIIASASTDNTIRLWGKDGRTIRILEGHSSSVNYVSFSPDGKIIASVSGDKTIKLWSKHSLKLQTTKLDELLVQSCHWLQNYLKTNPNVSKSDRHLCDDIDV